MQILTCDLLFEFTSNLLTVWSSPVQFGPARRVPTQPSPFHVVNVLLETPEQSDQPRTSESGPIAILATPTLTPLCPIYSSLFLPCHTLRLNDQKCPCERATISMAVGSAVVSPLDLAQFSALGGNSLCGVASGAKSAAHLMRS